jgi:hypothetical protein
MFPSYNTAEDAIAALETKEMIFAFRYLLQNKHPYLAQYLWQHGYYREEADKILQGKTAFFDNHVFQKFYENGVSSLGVLLTLMGEAHPADVKRFFSWRQWNRQPLYTVFAIDSEIVAALLISLLTNLRNGEFFTIGSCMNIIDSYEPLLRLKPDIVVVNHSLALIDGLKGIQLLKPLLPDTAFMLRSGRFTHSTAADEMMKAFELGVDYIDSMPGPLPSEFIPALRKTLNYFRERAYSS